MRTNVSSTSIEAFYGLLHSGEITRQHLEILCAIPSGQNMTRREIAVKIGYETSTVAARVNELIAAKRLAVICIRRDKYTKKMVKAVGFPEGDLFA